MKKQIVLLGLLLALLPACNSQVVRDTTIAPVATSVAKKEPQPTGLFYRTGSDSAGTVRYYPIMRGTEGGLFIERVSRKTGEPYRQYLKPEEWEQAEKMLNTKN